MSTPFLSYTRLMCVVRVGGAKGGRLAVHDASRRARVVNSKTFIASTAFGTSYRTEYLFIAVYTYHQRPVGHECLNEQTQQEAARFPS
jgi:hypothetical protein